MNGQLTAGMGGGTGQVLSIIAQPKEMGKLTVRSYHTFYVGVQEGSLREDGIAKLRQCVDALIVRGLMTGFFSYAQRDPLCESFSCRTKSEAGVQGVTDLLCVWNGQWYFADLSL